MVLEKTDYNSRNEKILDLGKVKRRNREIFRVRNNSFRVNRNNSLDLGSRSLMSKERSMV